MSTSLKNKTVKGAGWSAIDNISQYIISFFVSLILARLLSPEDYGLIGLITIFTVISTTIINGGFTSALIRKKNATDKDYNTVFIVNVVVSILLYFILYISAPYIAVFFSRTELVALVRVQSIGLVIASFAIVQRAKLIKKIDFKTQTNITVISSILGGIIGITCAYLGMRVWALVVYNLSLLCLSTLFLWFFNRWIPNFHFSKQSFNELFGYSWKLLFSGLLDSVWKEIYQLVIGKFYQPIQLGYFTRANQFAALFSSNLTNIVQRVSFPALSELQDDSIKLKEAYVKVIKLTMLVTFTLMMGLAAIAEPMIEILIGSKWLPCVPFLQILCFQMILYPLHAINLNMLQVKGRSDLFLKLEIYKKIVAVVPLGLGAFVGIYWMLWSSVVTGGISYYLNAFYSGKFVGYSFINQVKDILPSFCIAAFMAVCIYLFTMLDWNPFAIITVQLLIGFVISIILCRVICRQEYNEILNIICALKKKK